MAKAPAFQFYPADWRKDPAVQSLEWDEKGVWFEILCIMHESDQRGKLVLNGLKMPETALARLLGLDKQMVNQILSKLLAYGVAKEEQGSGIIYSKRMVEDERITQLRREAGKKGGNPSLLNQKSTTPVKQIPTPSSSSSTSVINLPKGKLSTKVDCPHQEIIKIYHEVLPVCPTVREWNATRAGYLRGRWNENTDRQNGDWWRNYFEYVKESPFLTGKAESHNGQPPFIASLEWLVKPTNFAKVIEGKYHR